jgi:hypothetical protein
MPQAQAEAVDGSAQLQLLGADFAPRYAAAGWQQLVAQLQIDVTQAPWHGLGAGVVGQVDFVLPASA